MLLLLPGCSGPKGAAGAVAGAFAGKPVRLRVPGCSPGVPGYSDPRGAAGALILDTTNTMKTIIIFSWQKCSLFCSLC